MLGEGRRWRRNSPPAAFAHGMNKTMLHQECEGRRRGIEAEAQAQAICMQTQDFRRAFEAFAARQKPVFEGN